MYAEWDKEFKKRIEDIWKGITGPAAEKQGFYIAFDENNKKIFFKGSKNKTQEFKK